MGLTAEPLLEEIGDQKMDIGWVVEGLRGEGPRVIYLHDWGESRYVALRDEVSALATLASELVVCDLPGHGDRRGMLVIDQAAMLPRVEWSRAEDRPIVLVGRGLGAWLSLAIASVSGNGVRAVVALDMPDCLPRAWRERIALWGWPGEPFGTASTWCSRLMGWGDMGRRIERQGKRYMGPRLLIDRGLPRPRGGERMAVLPVPEGDETGQSDRREDRQGLAKAVDGGYVDAIARFLREHGC